MASMIQRLTHRSLLQSVVLIAAGLGWLMATHGAFWLPCHPPKTFSWLLEVANWAACLSMTLGYLGLLTLPEENWPPRRRGILLAVLLLSILAFALPPFHSTDVTGYINRGWQQVAYGTNPYLTVIDQIDGWRQDEMFCNHWVTNPAPYGFAFMHLARGLMHAVQALHGHWNMALFAFKLVTLLATWSVAGLLATAGKHWLGWSRVQGLRAIVLMVANPIVLIHGLANAHNDIVMALPMMAALAVLPSVRWGWLAAPLAGLGGLVKLAAFSVMPMILMVQTRWRQWAILGWGLLMSAMVILVTSMTYLDHGQWQAWPLGKIAQNATVMHNSLPSLVWHPLEALLKLFPWPESIQDVLLNAVKHGIKTVFSLGFLIALVLMLRQVVTQSPPLSNSRDRFQSAVFWALCIQGALIAVFSAKFYPWYCNMFWPLALWLPVDSRLRRVTLALTLGQLFGITALGQAHVINVLVMWVLPVTWAWRAQNDVIALPEEFCPIASTRT